MSIIKRDDHILGWVSLEVSAGISADEQFPLPALILEHPPLGYLRTKILESRSSPPPERVRFDLAIQFAKGVAHLSRCGVFWRSMSTTNTGLFHNWRLKLCEFGSSCLTTEDPGHVWILEARYRSPAELQNGTLKHDIYALGSIIYEIMEWNPPYGSSDVLVALEKGELPEISTGNPARYIITKCWRGGYDLAGQVVEALSIASSWVELAEALGGRSAQVDVPAS